MSLSEININPGSASESSTNPMLTEDIYKTLRTMTVPMILGMVMLMTFGLVDTFFVSLLGTNELAAISFTFPVTFTVISLNIGLGIGTAAVIGHLLGKNELAKAKLTATAALMTVFGLVGLLCIIGYHTISLIFSWLGADDTLIPLIYEYMSIWYFAAVLLAIPMVGNSVLRAVGDTKSPSIIMASSGALNALLDPLLIFGWGPVPALEIQGAAIATAISWGVGVVWVLLLLHKRALMTARLLNLKEYQVHVSGVLKIGLPAAGANMLTPIAAGVVTAIVAGYGPTAVAAWGVGGRLESIASIVMLALSMSLPPLLSQNFGAQKVERVKAAYQIAIKFVVGFQLLVFVLLYLLADYIALVFAKETEVANLIALFLIIVPFGYGLQGVVVLTNSAFNAIHRPMAALCLNSLRLFIFFVPFCYLGSIYYGLTGLFVGAVLANAVMAFISYAWFMRMIKQEESTMVPNS
jgi:putative MATE family efflux protein